MVQTERFHQFRNHSKILEIVARQGGESEWLSWERMRVSQEQHARIREKKPPESEQFGREHSRDRAIQDEHKRIYDEERFETHQDADEMATEQTNKLTKMLVQMLWQLMGNTKVRASGNENDWSRPTD